MKNKEIISAVVGTTFFAVPYLALSVAFPPSILIGAAAFGASQLVLSSVNSKQTLKDIDVSLYTKVKKAKSQNDIILSFIPKVENQEIKQSLNNINDIVSKILTVISKEPKKADRIDNFFDYYLPVLIKIVQRYDEIEDKKINSKESKTFMSKANKMIKDTEEAFNTILSSLYQKDLMDMDAEMKVYNMMLKADGITGDTLMKGSESNEK